jgi:hypothetical protein
MDVTSIVNNWLTRAIPNEGLILMYSGETDVSAGVYKSLEEYRSIREEYQYYIDQNNRWWYNHYGSTFTPLEDYFRNKNVEDEEE